MLKNAIEIYVCRKNFVLTLPNLALTWDVQRVCGSPTTNSGFAGHFYSHPQKSHPHARTRKNYPHARIRKKVPTIPLYELSWRNTQTVALIFSSDESRPTRRGQSKIEPNFERKSLMQKASDLNGVI